MPLRYGKQDILRLKGQPSLAARIGKCGVNFALDEATESEFRAAGVPNSVLAVIPHTKTPQTKTDPPTKKPPRRTPDPEPVTDSRPTVPTQRNSRDGLDYIWIDPSTFTMGCSDGDTECNDDEKKRTRVNLTEGFWIGKTEVTQAAYARMTAGKDPSHFKGPRNPVEQVSWTEAKAYCQAAGMRLPWEREWEFAARAGTRSKYAGAAKPSDVAWYAENSGSKTHPVGGLKPNAWGLYDMLGNVWEWVEDPMPTTRAVQ